MTSSRATFAESPYVVDGSIVPYTRWSDLSEFLRAFMSVYEHAAVFPLRVA